MNAFNACFVKTARTRRPPSSPRRRGAQRTCRTAKRLLSAACSMSTVKKANPDGAPETQAVGYAQSLAPPRWTKGLDFRILLRCSAGRRGLRLAASLNANPTFAFGLVAPPEAERKRFASEESGPARDALCGVDVHLDRSGRRPPTQPAAMRDAERSGELAE